MKMTITNKDFEKLGRLALVNKGGFSSIKAREQVFMGDMTITELSKGKFYGIPAYILMIKYDYKNRIIYNPRVPIFLN